MSFALGVEETGRSGRARLGPFSCGKTGKIELGWYGTDTDPMDNMSLFSHPTRKSGEVFGGLTAHSNNRNARFVFDNDRDTWWQPDAGADPDNAWLHIDLGRLVLLKEIRLVFPDTLDVRPFRDFSVFVSEGSTVSPSADIWRFQRVFTTAEPNELGEIVIPLSIEDFGDAATGENHGDGQDAGLQARALHPLPAPRGRGRRGAGRDRGDRDWR